MNRLFLVAGILIFSFSVCAQADSSSAKVSYFISLHAGGLLGKKGNGTSLTSTFTNGIRYKRLSAGVGIGYDAYIEWRALPVFASLGLDVARIGSSAFFLELQGGYAKTNPWANEEPLRYKQQRGSFFHPVAGYRTTSGNLTVYFVAGYKMQDLTYEISPTWWGGWGVKNIVKQDIDRFSIQIGIGFR